MTPVADRVKKNLQNLAALKKMLDKVDPASGLTVKVWRGPMESDSEDYCPEVVGVEICTHLEETLAALIAGIEDSLKMEGSFLRGDLKATQEALDLLEKHNAAKAQEDSKKV
jgi:hypothetical protein